MKSGYTGAEASTGEKTFAAGCTLIEALPLSSGTPGRTSRLQWSPTARGSKDFPKPWSIATTGVDVDDGRSSLNSPELGTTTLASPVANDNVSIMLEVRSPDRLSSELRGQLLQLPWRRQSGPQHVRPADEETP